jgi:hypothetical protein
MLRQTLRLSARSLKANRAFATEAGFNYEELFQDSKATKTPFKKLTSDHVSTFEVQSPDDLTLQERADAHTATRPLKRRSTARSTLRSSRRPSRCWPSRPWSTSRTCCARPTSSRSPTSSRTLRPPRTTASSVSNPGVDCAQPLACLTEWLPNCGSARAAKERQRGGRHDPAELPGHGHRHHYGQARTAGGYRGRGRQAPLQGRVGDIHHHQPPLLPGLYASMRAPACAHNGIASLTQLD